MSPFSRSGFADDPVLDLRERVLACICARGNFEPGAQVNAQSVAHELGIEANELFKTVLLLVDYGFLLYVGAGPVVEITELGARQAEGVQEPPNDPLPS